MTGYIKRSDEEMKILQKKWEKQKEVSEDVERELESRICNPCGECVLAGNCKRQDAMDEWREDQKYYARKDKDGMFYRTCGARYPRETMIKDDDETDE